MKKITVIVDTARWSFSADAFDVDENGYLKLTADSAVVARFSPAAWHGVFDETAVSA